MNSFSAAKICRFFICQDIFIRKVKASINSTESLAVGRIILLIFNLSKETP
jgi:hypothetical protein